MLAGLIRGANQATLALEDSEDNILRKYPPRAPDHGLAFPGPP